MLLLVCFKMHCCFSDFCFRITLQWLQFQTNNYLRIVILSTLFLLTFNLTRSINNRKRQRVHINMQFGIQEVNESCTCIVQSCLNQGLLEFLIVYIFDVLSIYIYRYYLCITYKLNLVHLKLQSKNAYNAVVFTHKCVFTVPPLMLIICRLQNNEQLEFMQNLFIYFFQHE